VELSDVVMRAFPGIGDGWTAASNPNAVRLVVDARTDDFVDGSPSPLRKP
jgi:predicted secreted protein